MNCVHAFTCTYVTAFAVARWQKKKKKRKSIISCAYYNSLKCVFVCVFSSTCVQMCMCMYDAMESVYPLFVSSRGLNCSSCCL